MSDLTRRSILKLGSALIAGGFSPLRVSAQNATSGKLDVNILKSTGGNDENLFVSRR